MKQTRTWQGLATLPLLNTGHTFAAPIEGEAASNAAAILVLLSLPLPARGAEHGSKGFEFETADGRYLLQIDTRMQFRLSHPSDDNPVTFEPEPDQTSFDLRRARLKVGGHAGYEWLKYYWEFDFPSSRLLDFRVTAQWREWLGIRVRLCGAGLSLTICGHMEMGRS